MKKVNLLSKAEMKKVKGGGGGPDHCYICCYDSPLIGCFPSPNGEADGCGDPRNAVEIPCPTPE